MHSSGKIALFEHARANRIVDVVVDICNPVSERYHNALQRGWRTALLVVQDASAHLKRKIQPCAVVFQLFYDAELTAVSANPSRQQRIQHILAGVPERRVTRSCPIGIASVRSSLRRSARNRPRNLGYLPAYPASNACDSGLPAGKRNTCVLCLSRQNGTQCKIRSRSRINSVQIWHGSMGASVRACSSKAWHKQRASLIPDAQNTAWGFLCHTSVSSVPKI